MLGRIPIRRFHHWASSILSASLLIPLLCGTQARADWLFDEVVSNSGDNWQRSRAADWDVNGWLHTTWATWNYVYYGCQQDSVWQSPEFIGYGYEPVLEVGPGATPHVVWSEGGSIYYSKRTNGSWSYRELVGSYGYASRPALAVEASGAVNVAWHDSRNGSWDIYYRRFVGASWGPETRLTTGTEESSYPAIAADLNGNIHVVWRDNRNGNYELYWKQWNGVAWSAEQRVTNTQGSKDDPQLATDSNGVLYLIWRDASSSGIQMKTRSGGPWSSTIQISTPGYEAAEPSLAVDESGMIHLVYREFAYPSWQIIYRTMMDGQLQDAVQLSHGTPSHEQPCVAVRDPNRIAVLWRDTRTGEGRIWHRQYRPLSPPLLDTCSPPRTERESYVSFELLGENFSRPDSAWISAPGRPRIIGLIDSSTPHRILCHMDLSQAAIGSWDITVQNPDGQRAVLTSGLWIHEDLWSEPERLNTAWSEAIYPDAAEGSDGRVHLVWQDNRDGNWEIYCRHGFDQGWTAEERLTQSPANSIYPSICTGPDGDAYLVWQDDRDGLWKVYFKHWDGEQWSLDLRLTDAYGDSNRPTIAVGSDDRIHVAWQDSRHGNPEIYYKWWNGQTWSEEIRLTNSAGSAERPALAAGADGRIHLAWQDDRSGTYAIHHMELIGETWSPEESVSEGSGIATRAAISEDSQGRLHLAWENELNGERRVFARWREGEAWSEVTALSPTSTSAVGPSLAADGVGHSYVVWEDSRYGCPQVLYRAWDGGGWLGEERLAPGYCGNMDPVVTATPSGRIRVFWHDTRYGPSSVESIVSPHQYLDPPTLTGVEPGSVESFGTHELQVHGQNLLPAFAFSMIGPDGELITGSVAYISADEIRFTADFTRVPLGDCRAVFSNPAGSDTLEHALEITASSWSDETRLTSDGAFSIPAYNYGHAAALDADGRVHIVWSDGRPGNPEIYWKTRDQMGWSSDTRLTTANGSSSMPSLAASDSVTVLVWQDARSGNNEIYARFYAGGQWSAENRVTDTPTPSLYPSSVIAGDGAVHLVWQELTNEGAEIFYSTHGPNGWTTPEQITLASGSAVFPTVAWSETLGFYVAWMDDSNGNFEIYYRHNDGSGFGPETRVTYNDQNSWYPSLAAGPSGQIYAVWQDERDGNFEIYGQALDHDDTAARLTQTSGASGSPQLATDPAGMYHLVWIEDRGSVAQAYYKTFSDGVWSPDHRVSGSPTSVSNVHVAAGAYENRAIVWQDERDGNSEIYGLTHESAATSGTQDAEYAGRLAITFAPNPFGDRGEFVLGLPTDQAVSLQIFDLSGRRVCLVQDGVFQAGEHHLGWDARDEQGRRIVSGVYFYRLDAGATVRTGRLVRLQ